MSRFPLLHQFLTGVSPLNRFRLGLAQMENPAVSAAGPQPDCGRNIEAKDYTMEAALIARANGASAPPRAVKPSFSPVPLPLEHIIQEGRAELTPTLAKRILAEANYERQRKLKPYRLHRHKSAIRKGQWDGDCTIRFVLLGGRLVLVDGQHRCTVVAETGVTVPVIFVITAVSSEADLHTTYSRIDVDGNRSISDVLNASDPTAGRDIAFELRRSAFRAMDNLANDFPHVRLKAGENDLVTKEDRVVCMTFWLDELELFDHIVRDGQRSLRDRLRQSGILSVALATLKHQRPKAQAFWTAVASNHLLKTGDPEQALVNFLLTSRLDDAARVAERGAAQAWNAWFNSRRLNAVRKDTTSKSPIRIAGTPFQGRA